MGGFLMEGELDPIIYLFIYLCNTNGLTVVVNSFMGVVNPTLLCTFFVKFL
jgi:hypothetical protein